MAWYEVKFRLAVVVITAISVVSSAQSTTQPAVPTLPPLPSCPPAQFSILPCIGYVLGVGSSPLTSCCSQLQTVFETQGPCICAMLKGAPSQLGLFIGQVQAMLPSACNFPSNPCVDISGPGIVPTTPTPSPSVPATATSPTTPSEATPAITPTTPSDPDKPVVPTAPTDVSPATVTAAGQRTPSGAGSDTQTSIAARIPALFNSAAAGSSRNTADATRVLIPLLAAYLSAMHAF